MLRLNSTNVLQYHNNKYFHNSRPKADAKNISRLSEIRCYNCERYGHYRRDCGDKRSISDTIREQLHTGSFVIHIVHELTSATEKENISSKNAHERNHPSDVAEFDNHSKEAEKPAALETYLVDEIEGNNAFNGIATQLFLSALS